MAYHIIPLDSPPAPTIYGTGASALNNRGVVAGHASMPGTHATYWTPAAHAIPVVAQLSIGYGINDLGDVVGTWGNASFPGQAFLFRNGVVLDLAGAFKADVSLLTDINDSGIACGWAGKIGTPHAVRYDTASAKATDLGTLPGLKSSYAAAVNRHGQIAGTSRNNGTPQNSHAFLWDGNLRSLGPATSTNDLNDDGVVVGARVVEGATHWTAFALASSDPNGEFEDLGPLPIPGFVGSEAMGINNHGDIVGHSFTDFGPGQMIRAFLRRSDGVMQDLNSLIPPNSGWLLEWAMAINDRGHIAGTGSFQGERKGYLLKPDSILAQPPQYAAIDPMAVILPGRVYQIWVELHHPHVPRVAEVKEVLRRLSTRERTAALQRARQLAEYGKVFEKALSEMGR